MSPRARSRRTRTSLAAVIATAIAIGAAGAIGLGVGAGAGAGPVPGLVPAKTIPGATTSTSSTTATSSTTTSAPEIIDTGSPLPARASLSQLAAALRPILGPTDDFTADVGRIIELPDGVPTPVGAQIVGVEVDAWATGDFQVVVDMRSPAVADDVALFYEATMLENGYQVFTRTTNQDAEGRSQDITFSSTDPDPDRADVSVTVSVTDSDDHIVITVFDRSTGSPLEAYVGWTTGLSAFDGGVADGVTLTLSTGDAPGVSFSTRYLYDADSADDVAADIRASLPAGGFSIDEDTTPDTDTDTDPDPGTVDEIPLRNALLDDTRIVISDSPSSGVVVVVSGNLQLSR